MPITTRVSLVRRAPGTYETAQVELDDPRQGEVTVKLAASGLCHSDDHVATGDVPVAVYPYVGGHGIRRGVRSTATRSAVTSARTTDPSDVEATSPRNSSTVDSSRRARSGTNVRQTRCSHSSNEAPVRQLDDSLIRTSSSCVLPLTTPHPDVPVKNLAPTVKSGCAAGGSLKRPVPPTRPEHRPPSREPTMLDLSPRPGDLEPVETVSVDQLRALQTERLQWSVRHAFDNVQHYRAALIAVGVHPDDVKSLEDLARLPFTTKEDLRQNYPFGTFAVPREEVVRVRASSGRTGSICTPSTSTACPR